jgi:hypothetical protein
MAMSQMRIISFEVSDNSRNNWINVSHIGRTLFYHSSAFFYLAGSSDARKIKTDKLPRVLEHSQHFILRHSLGLSCRGCVAVVERLRFPPPSKM